MWALPKEDYIYIMTNRSRTFYTGVTSDVMKRVHQHKQKLVPGFTSTYNMQYFVNYASTSSIYTAIEREKQITGWIRAKKIALIESMDPAWKDLREDRFAK